MSDDIATAIRRYVESETRAMKSRAQIFACWDTAYAIAEVSAGWWGIGCWRARRAALWGAVATVGPVVGAWAVEQLAQPIPWRIAMQLRKRMMYGPDRALWLGGGGP
jgi:hypothetical protein